MNGNPFIVFVHLKRGNDPVRRHDTGQTFIGEDFEKDVDGVEATAWLTSVPFECPKISHHHSRLPRRTVHAGFGSSFKRSEHDMRDLPELPESRRVSPADVHSKERPDGKKQTPRGRAQDRARVAGGQDHEVNYEATKEGVSKDTVKKAVKRAGNSRKKVEAQIGRH